MRYPRYDAHFVFVKGTDLLTADTLSRAHQDDSGNDQGDRARIMEVHSLLVRSSSYLWITGV